MDHSPGLQKKRSSTNRHYHHSHDSQNGGQAVRHSDSVALFLQDGPEWGEIEWTVHRKE